MTLPNLCRNKRGEKEMLGEKDMVAVKFKKKKKGYLLIIFSNYLQTQMTHCSLTLGF